MTLDKVNIVQQDFCWVMITSKSIIFYLSRQKQFDADPDGANPDKAKSMFVSTIFEIIKENYDKQIVKK